MRGYATQVFSRFSIAHGHDEIAARACRRDRDSRSRQALLTPALSRRASEWLPPVQFRVEPLFHRVHVVGRLHDGEEFPLYGRGGELPKKRCLTVTWLASRMDCNSQPWPGARGITFGIHFHRAIVRPVRNEKVLPELFALGMRVIQPLFDRDVVWLRASATQRFDSVLAIRGAGGASQSTVPGIGPELLQRVILAGFFVEQMNYHVAVILQNPRAGGVALHSQAFFAEFFGQRGFNFIGNGVKLPAAGAGDDDEEIEHGRQFTQIEQDDILPCSREPPKRRQWPLAGCAAVDRRVLTSSMRKSPMKPRQRFLAAGSGRFSMFGQSPSIVSSHGSQSSGKLVRKQ